MVVRVALAKSEAGRFIRPLGDAKCAQQFSGCPATSVEGFFQVLDKTILEKFAHDGVKRGTPWSVGDDREHGLKEPLKGLGQELVEAELLLER
jgi:hypothetical protein